MNQMDLLIGVQSPISSAPREEAGDRMILAVK